MISLNLPIVSGAAFLAALRSLIKALMNPDMFFKPPRLVSCWRIMIRTAQSRSAAHDAACIIHIQAFPEERYHTAANQTISPMGDYCHKPYGLRN
jgi:hypothetical protein